MQVAEDSTPFWGVSRSFTYLHTAGRWPTCTRCGSSLAGRHEKTRTVAGGAVDVFRCGCGRGRQVRRAA